MALAPLCTHNLAKPLEGFDRGTCRPPKLDRFDDRAGTWPGEACVLFESNCDMELSDVFDLIVDNM